MKVIRTLWRWIISSKGRLQAFFDLLLLILSPIIFVPLIASNLDALDKGSFIITLVILCYIQITRWFTHWFCNRKHKV